MIFDPPFPIPLVVALVAIAVGVAIWREISGERKFTPGWFHPLCLALRITAILSLAIVLLNPSRNKAGQPTSGKVVILLDSSASMTLPDKNGTRWDAALTFSQSVAEKIQTAETVTFSRILNADEPDPKPEGRETNLSAALEQLLADGNHSDSPENIIVLSDGRIHDRDRLGQALRLAEARKIPVSTRVFGIDSPPRNTTISAAYAPRMVRPRSPVSVHVDIGGSGITSEEELTLTLENDAGETLAQSRFSLSESSPTEQVLVFESDLRSATYHLELTVSGEPEVDLDDNQFTFLVEIAGEKLRVIFVEGTHWKRAVGDKGHFWNDMELMTRAWEATGEIEHYCLSPLNEYLNQPNLGAVTFHNGEMQFDFSRGFPETREELYSYDVMLISDVPVGNFSREQMEWVVDWVEKRGAGFLMGGGHTTFDSGEYDKTPWEKIVPVDMKAYGKGFSAKWFQIDIPQAVRGHPLWTLSPVERENEKILAAHPRFAGMNHVRRAKPGAIVLAFRKGTDEPVIAAQRYGRGRSIAFLPDPNGGWGRFYADWGPPDGPFLNPNWIHLGQGKKFRFDKAAATRNPGPSPPHPSAWYGQYWVNVVRWLGENSIRWQRDQLAGRIEAARAHPGRKLKVAAEFLPITEVDDLLSLDLGARLDLLGSRRTRLLYDRDRREFTGQFSVPSSVENAAPLKVVFDVMVGEKTYSQVETIGVHRGNPEFDDPAPDPIFLAGLADATGGRILETVEDAVTSNREAVEKRRSQSNRSQSIPLWSKWLPWLIFAICFCGEWALRRRGNREVDSYSK